MLVGVVVAAAAAPRKAGGCAKAFFEGAGYGFTHIISLIVVANCFGEGIKQVGLAEVLGDFIRAEPRLLTPLAVLVPWLFAVVSGSGMASTQSLYGFFFDPAVAVGQNPNDVGAMVSTGAAAGRTMSPVAAVALMCGKLTDTSPWPLVGRVAIPLLCGLAVVIALRMLGAV
jgi:DcuC family C4-dicarboxylate transporter